MTREEAIYRLKNMAWLYGSAEREQNIEAIDMAIEALQREDNFLKDLETNTPTERGVYQCFHCGSYSVVWGTDFDFSDYGLEGEGIVHSCHCGNCGADIEYYVRIDDD